MRKLLCLLTFVTLSLLLQAKEYYGTFIVDNSYKLENIKAELLPDKDGSKIIRIHRVKFSFWMPMRVDFDLPNITDQEGKLNCKYTIPLMKGEPYNKKPASHLTGSYNDKKLSFDVLLGDTPIRFEAK